MRKIGFCIHCRKDDQVMRRKNVCVSCAKKEKEELREKKADKKAIRKLVRENE